MSAEPSSEFLGGRERVDCGGPPGRGGIFAAAYVRVDVIKQGNSVGSFGCL